MGKRGLTGGAALNVKDVAVPVPGQGSPRSAAELPLSKLLPGQALRNPGREERHPRCPQQERGHRDTPPPILHELGYCFGGYTARTEP